MCVNCAAPSASSPRERSPLLLSRPPRGQIHAEDFLPDALHRKTQQQHKMSSGGKKQRKWSRSPAHCGYACLNPVLRVATLHPSLSLHNAQSQSLTGAKFPGVMQPGAGRKPSRQLVLPPGDEHLIGCAFSCELELDTFQQYAPQ